MKRNKIEQMTASIAVLLLFLMTIIGITFFADLIFEWDLFPPQTEKILGFFMASGVIIIISSVMVNIMINLSIISLNSQLFIKMKKENDKRKK